MSLRKNLHGARVVGGAAVNNDEFIQKQQAGGGGGTGDVSFEYNAVLNAIKILWQNNAAALDVLGIVRNGSINIEAIDALVRLKGASGYEQNIDEYGFSFFSESARLLNVNDERIATILDLMLNNTAIYFTQLQGEISENDTRIVKSGKFEKYVAGAGWVDISVAANGSLTTYLGEWDASANNPEITSGAGSAGDWYLVGVAGSTVIDGLTPWGVGDVIWYSSSAGAWQMISNQVAAPTKPMGATGAVQIRGADGNFDWTTDLLFDTLTRAIGMKRARLLASTPLVTPQSGVLEYTGTELFFTLSDLVRRSIPVKLSANKIFFGGASNEITEIAAIDVYGASAAIKTFLDTEANWLDGSGYPKSSVFPGGGEVGQKHRNTNYIFECVALAEWVRYILPAGYIDLYGVPSAAKILIENTANWTGKVYTGTALTGCLQGMKHFNNDYFFEFVLNNTPVRGARV